MDQLLSSIFDKQVVVTPEGKEEPLDSNIDREEAFFLQKMIKTYGAKNSLEVGCAMGISSLAICEAIAGNYQSSHHIIIDPFQRSDWKSIGINHLKKAGFSNFSIIEEPSEFALPRLVRENHQIDFAFIDGFHTFDQTVVDFFYINRLLRPGGILVVDDVRMPSVKRVMRMIHTYPAYRFLGGVRVPYTSKVKVLEALKTGLRPVTKLLGQRLSSELLDDSVRKSDRVLGLNSSVVAFQKTAEDNRPWNWYQPF